MPERMFVALDLETTGLDAARDSIIEVGAVRFCGNSIVDTFTTLVNPQRPIPRQITELTGIRTADVASAPTIDRVAPELLAFAGSDTAAVIAHNAAFDLGFNCAVAEDACATMDLFFNNKTIKASEVHSSFMAALSFPYAKVVLTKDIVKDMV